MRYLESIPMLRRVTRRHVVVAIGAASTLFGLAGCLALDVTNQNNLTLDNVFNNSANAEASLIGGWKRYYGLIMGAGTSNGSANCPQVPLAAWGNAVTTIANTTYLEGPQEPRVPIDNVNTLQCANRGPWYDAYSAIASGRESYQGIIANKLTYGTVDATTPNGKDTGIRLLFGKWLVALGQMNLGLRFDQAFITDITTPQGSEGGDLKGYKEVEANAILQMRAVIADARALPDFTFPSLWVNGNTGITRDVFIRICQSYIARATVYQARNAADRDAVNWAGVLALLDSGITKDFTEQADPAVALTSAPFITVSFSQTTVRISNRLLGPADTSGQYQIWLNTSLATRAPITITTPDRRIHGATNTTAGTRFTYLATNQTNGTLQPWLASKYRSNRYLTTAGDSGTKALVQIIPLQEMQFIRAEALYRLNRGAEAAAIINPTRLAANLKAVDANGPPAGRDCVPRKDDGTCGNLFDAIQYEKRIELFPGPEADVFWYDARGWGKLISGTPYHLPVSGRELTQLGLPFYTFGGTGSPGSAP